MTLRSLSARISCAALLAAGLSGCLGYITLGAADRQAGVYEDLPPSRSMRYSIEAVPNGPFEAVNSDYQARRLVFEGHSQNGALPRLEVRHYRGNNQGPRPLVIVVPVWGDGLYSYPSDSIRKHIIKRADGRIDVLEIAGSAPLIDWERLAGAQTEEEFSTRIRATVERYRHAAVAIRGMIDWAEQQPGIDDSRVGIVGFSIGAVAAANALGADRRFSAGVLVMAAARLDSVFANCGGRTGAVREQVGERLGWEPDEYENRLRRLLEPIDPARGDFQFDPREILIVDAMLDRCVPRHARRALWEAMGKPKRISFIAMHRHAFLSQTPLGLYFGNRRIYRFLRERLLE